MKGPSIISVGPPRRNKKSSPHRSCMSSIGWSKTCDREPQGGGSPRGSQIKLKATTRAVRANSRRKRRNFMSDAMLPWRGKRWGLGRVSAGQHVNHRPGSAMARRWHARPRAHPCRCDRPGIIPGLCCLFGVEPPAGIEPATPSLPWNYREPLCGPPLPQVALDRWGQSYGFSLGKGMRSLSGHALRQRKTPPTSSSDRIGFPSTIGPRSGGRHQSAEQYGSSDHRRTAASAALRTAAPSTSTREGGISRSGHTQTKASGPGGGRGRTR
jgi:hypothetical protein